MISIQRLARNAARLLQKHFVRFRTPNATACRTQKLTTIPCIHSLCLGQYGKDKWRQSHSLSVRPRTTRRVCVACSCYRESHAECDGPTNRNFRTRKLNIECERPAPAKSKTPVRFSIACIYAQAMPISSFLSHQ